MKDKKISLSNVLFGFFAFLCLVQLGCSNDSDNNQIDKSTRPDLYTFVPDDNFEQLLINQGYDDVLDNYITTADVQDVTQLLFTSGHNGPMFDPSGITNFTGIEAFVSLESFDCSSLGLTSLDLSANVALKSLNCSDNNLVSLDLSNLTQLEGVSCGYNNLNSLVLNSANLTGLSCHENNLANIDVSQATVLTNLTCFGNNLTSLDITQNVSLTTLQASNNLFETLDISQNTALSYIECDLNPNLTCVQVNETQLLQNWSFCSSDLFSLNCN